MSDTSALHIGDEGVHIESASTTPVTDNNNKPASELSLKEQLMALDARRSAVRRAVHEALDYLATTPVGMDGPLVDAEGYPRNDCDLYAIRQARQDVIRGRNDLRALDDELYEKLNALHEENAAEGQAQMARDAAEAAARAAAKDAATKAHNAKRDRLATATALVRVARVEATSPAELAGLRAGMKVLQYGDLTHDTLHNNSEGSKDEVVMQAMARVTQEHEGRMLPVWVQEEPTGPSETLPAPRELFVVPQRWAGSGLLGCGFDRV